MNVLPVALLIFAVVFLAGVLCFGLATLLQIRARRERLQMKRHLQTIEWVWEVVLVLLTFHEQADVS